MMSIVWQQQQITALSEEVKYLKVLVENINKEMKTVETEYPDDKKATMCVRKVSDKDMGDNINTINKENKIASPDGEKETNSLVNKVSKECYRCEECDYKGESETSIK